LILACGAAVVLGGCMHRGVDNISAGDVAIDSLSATRTAILRVENNTGAPVRVYMKVPGMKDNYVAKALPGSTRSWLLDPQMFPAQSVAFDVTPEGGTAVRVGPFRVNRGEVVDVVVPADPMRARASVHRSTP
jgi:hypothetical protein